MVNASSNHCRVVAITTKHHVFTPHQNAHVVAFSTREDV
ncbi:Uncharacterised protein [Vibrio cholerae]|nr:Uncharacterised protein [Vibrio cholerae]